MDHNTSAHSTKSFRDVDSRDDLEALVTAVSDSLGSFRKTTTTPLFISSDAAQLIDHTLLSLDATPEQIESLCEEAATFNFRAVCIRPTYVSLAKEKLLNRNVDVACVVGFPEGTQPTAEKTAEAIKAILDGASELDMVLNYEALKSGDLQTVHNDVKAIRDAISQATTLKVILETSQLSTEQIVTGCVLSCKAGANFVKTSTGFRGRGASVEDVKLMRAACDITTPLVANERVKVKASGGIRTGDDLIQMAQAGAERIGASAGVKILETLQKNGPEKTSRQPVTDDVY